MSRGMNFTKQGIKDRMRRQGFEEAQPRALHYPPQQPAERARAEQLEAYLRDEPCGERDVEHLLNTPARRKRDAWLRAVLDADRD